MIKTQRYGIEPKWVAAGGSGGGGGPPRVSA